MSATVAVLEAHQYKAADRGCSCENNWYDTRQTPEQDLHEHAIHVEKELLDAGISEIAEARAQALEDAAAAIDGETADSLYATRKRELSGPYSKPMDPEHWASSTASKPPPHSSERVPPLSGIPAEHPSQLTVRRLLSTQRRRRCAGFTTPPPHTREKSHEH